MAKKVVIVTGAARGIGHATCQVFAEHNYRVVGIDINVPENSAPVDSFVQADVADPDQVFRAVSHVDSQYGQVDALVNIAGTIVVKPLEETSWEEFHRMYTVNVGGTFSFCKHVIPIMKRQGRGVIVNMASVSGHVGQTDHVIYGGTKGAILSMVRALAWELAPHNIRVNSVSPGSIDTEMLRSDVAMEAERLNTSVATIQREREQEQALGRWATPREVAHIVYFLCQEETSFVTGSDYLVDGGWVAK